MYAAFGRGDIPALLSHLSSEVDWRLSVDLTAPGAKRIPDFRPFRGREGVQAFFSIIDEELEFHSFQPLSFMTSGNEVAVMRLPNLRTGNFFAKGHRVRIVLCGSFMPAFSRNLQTGESETRSAAMRKGTIRIHHSSKYPSRIVVPALSDGDGDGDGTSER